jgi:uncharacterized protein YkwD
MPKKPKQENRGSKVVTYKKMAEEEIEATRNKLGIANPKPPNNLGKECERHACNEEGDAKCQHCNKVHCKYHSPPVLVTSFDFIQGLKPSEDYEKWEKYNYDWRREDGHPCPEYTTWWNKDHATKLATQIKIVNKPWLGKNPHEYGGRSGYIPPRPTQTSSPGVSPKSPSKKVWAGLLALLLIGIIVFYIYLSSQSWLNPSAYVTNKSTLLTTVNPLNYTNSSYTNQTPKTQETTVLQSSGASNDTALQYYVLSLINTDRNQNGLPNVTLSNITSGQQHAQNLLEYHYMGHWDIYGMKPYMRYTLLNGTGAVSENVAHQFGQICSILCTGDIDTRSALQQMEHSMMYDDAACCENGHRDNILDPNHNQVSIGIATDGSNIYLVEDFIDNYINWNNGSPEISVANDEMYLSGQIQNDYSFSQISISFDPPVTNMSVAKLNSTFSYSYGNQIAGVATGGAYYTTMTTLNADQYSVNNNKFDISFNLQNLIRQNGAGEYTILVWLDNESGESLVGSTYTVFVNSNMQPYIPTNI